MAGPRPERSGGRPPAYRPRSDPDFPLPDDVRLGHTDYPGRLNRPLWDDPQADWTGTFLEGVTASNPHYFYAYRGDNRFHAFGGGTREQWSTYFDYLDNHPIGRFYNLFHEGLAQGAAVASLTDRIQTADYSRDTVRPTLLYGSGAEMLRVFQGGPGVWRDEYQRARVVPGGVPLFLLQGRAKGNALARARQQGIEQTGIGLPLLLLSPILGPVSIVLDAFFRPSNVPNGYIHVTDIRLERSLHQSFNYFLGAVRTAVEAAAAELEREFLERGREEVPVDTGTLRDSLYVRRLRQYPRSEDDFKLLSSLPYFEPVAVRDGFVERARSQIDWGDTLNRTLSSEGMASYFDEAIRLAEAA